MKIAIVVPSEEYLQQAGVRIRYRRIEKALISAGHCLAFVDIQAGHDRSAREHDVFIFSKCYDARAWLFTRILADEGKRIGIDLFDDYFSQERDSRLVRLRRWLQTAGGAVDFVLCSTPAMRTVAERAIVGVPCHVMNDPAAGVDLTSLQATLRHKLERARKTQILDVCWFGMGDNPYFPVGLHDLSAFGGELVRMRGGGFEIRLSVLTNLRAMTGEGLALLRRLPFEPTIEEWSEEREAATLARSIACFLPVNAQNFSIVKSLNRCLSALMSGTQVLSAGYPLYRPFKDFVYRDARQLVSDVESSSLALRGDTASEFADLATTWGDAAGEAGRLLQFLATIGKRPLNGPQRRTPPLAAVVHGKETTGDIHKFAQRTKMLSVASPFCDAKLHFDIRFQFEADGDNIEYLLSERAAELVDSDADVVGSADRLAINGTTYLRCGVALDKDGARGVATLARGGDVAVLVASYQPVMTMIAATLTRLYPDIAVYYSDNSKLPLIPSYTAIHHQLKETA